MAKSSISELRERVGSLRALAEGDAPNARSDLEKLALDSDTEVNIRREAIYLLGRYFVESLPQLLPLLESQDEPLELRAAVMDSIGENRLVHGIEAVRKSAEDRGEDFRIRSTALSILGQLDPSKGKPLIQSTVSDKMEDVRLRRSLVHYLYPDVDDEARNLLQKIIKDKSEDNEVRAAAVDRLTPAADPDVAILLGIIQDADENYEVRNSALMSLTRRDEDSIIDSLVALARSEDMPRGIRMDIIGALARLSHRDDVRSMVIDAIVNEPGFAAAWSFNVQAEISWTQVVEEFLEALKRSTRRRNEIDAAGIISSLFAATRDSDDFLGLSRIAPEQIQEMLISAALDADERLTGILGKLIVETSEGDQAIAGQSINNYQDKHNTAPEKLRRLRIAIGGEKALDPIMRTLNENLEQRFHKPIKEINDRTQEMWKDTMKHAQFGFLARIWMSVIVFIVGIGLLIASSVQFLSGDVSGSEIFGSGVSFVAGLGMTLLVVYSGPLKEIRQSVNDLGIANAAFIAYVHRVLEISHTFSFYYLQQKISFVEMSKSSKLIQEAMFDTIKSFRYEAIDTSNDSFAKVLDRTPEAEAAEPKDPGATEEQKS